MSYDLQTFLLKTLELIDSLLPLLISVALIVFLWNMTRYAFFEGESAEGREKARSLAIWGILAFFVITSVWGIVNIVIGMINPDNRGIYSDYMCTKNSAYCTKIGNQQSYESPTYVPTTPRQNTPETTSEGYTYGDESTYVPYTYTSDSNTQTSNGYNYQPTQSDTAPYTYTPPTTNTTNSQTNNSYNYQAPADTANTSYTPPTSGTIDDVTDLGIDPNTDSRTLTQILNDMVADMEAKINALKN
jgi:hypothetical protein